MSEFIFVESHDAQSVAVIGGYNGCMIVGYAGDILWYLTIMIVMICNDMQWYAIICNHIIKVFLDDNGLNAIHWLQFRSCWCFGTGTPWECWGEESYEGGAFDRTMSMIGVLEGTWCVQIWLLTLGIKESNLGFIYVVAISSRLRVYMMDHDGDILNRRSAYRGHRNYVYKNRVPQKLEEWSDHHFPLKWLFAGISTL